MQKQQKSYNFLNDRINIPILLLKTTLFHFFSVLFNKKTLTIEKWIQFRIVSKTNYREMDPIPYS